MGQSVLTSTFARRDGALYCEDVPAEAIAQQAGTPVFVYSVSVIRDRYRRLQPVAAGRGGGAAGVDYRQRSVNLLHQRGQVVYSVVRGIARHDLGH